MKKDKLDEQIRLEKEKALLERRVDRLEVEKEVLEKEGKQLSDDKEREVSICQGCCSTIVDMIRFVCTVRCRV